MTLKGIFDSVINYDLTSLFTLESFAAFGGVYCIYLLIVALDKKLEQ